MLIRLILMRLVGVVFIVSGLMLVFSQLQGLSKKVLSVGWGMIKRKKK